jgi:hypothetical protein
MIDNSYKWLATTNDLCSYKSSSSLQFCIDHDHVKWISQYKGWQTHN